MKNSVPTTNGVEKNVVVFDLDHTLINGDSAVLWNEFVQEQGVVNDPGHLKQLRAFDQAYHAGCLDAPAYQRFTMKAFPLYELTELEALRDRFFHVKVTPVLLEQAQGLIQRHHDRGDITLLMSATNSFLTDPFCKLWGMSTNLSTTPELKKGRLSGSVAGEPSFKLGKVNNLKAWLKAQGMTDSKITFYSDSHNDLPLLDRVDHPVAVDPDPLLRSTAVAKGWPIISLRDDKHLTDQ